MRIDSNAMQRWLRKRAGLRKELSINGAAWGDDWPLTETSGTLVCDTMAVTFITDEDRTYALNGNARARMTIESWSDGDLIRRFNDGQYRSMDRLIALALKL